MTGWLAALAAGCAGWLLVPQDGSGSWRRLGRLGAARHGPTSGARSGFRRRLPPPAVPGPVLLDLVAAVLRAGAPVTTALRLVADALGEHDRAASGGVGPPVPSRPSAPGTDRGDPSVPEVLRRLADRYELGLDGGVTAAGGGGTLAPPGWFGALEDALKLAREAGIAPAPLLASAAADERRRQAAAARVAAARLGVRVVLPTGLCLLPAFVLLAVVPLVIALVVGR